MSATRKQTFSSARNSLFDITLHPLRQYGESGSRNSPYLSFFSFLFVFMQQMLFSCQQHFYTKLQKNRNFAGSVRVPFQFNRKKTIISNIRRVPPKLSGVVVKALRY